MEIVLTLIRYHTTVKIATLGGNDYLSPGISMVLVIGKHKSVLTFKPSCATMSPTFSIGFKDLLTNILNLSV